MQVMQETGVQSLGQEDPLEKMATHSGILFWKIPWTEEHLAQCNGGQIMA